MILKISVMLEVRMSSKCVTAVLQSEKREIKHGLFLQMCL